ncbi:hypothetical protein MSP7336_04689 [Mycobacterium shimoidei]|uniref:Uncharacterized protein n=1 Tax=Mycobacterium shimoidei TaxID=29313 RepID=A0A375Z5G5_MYCSH|nr:hypothetical protein MSP7336_04689 [Mycobacterium shimoidei]
MGTGMACSPAKPARPAKPPTTKGAAANGTNGRVNSGRKTGSSTSDCWSKVFSNAMVSVMIVPMASMVVNSNV